MKFSFFIFILVSALIHASIISMQDEWVFSISEYHEQGSSILNIEITSEHNSAQSIPLGKHKEKIVTKKSQPQPIRKKSLTTVSRTSPFPSENTLSEKKNIDQKATRYPEETVTEKNPQVATPEHQSLQKKILSENSTSPVSNNAGNIKKNSNNETLKTLLNTELAKHFYYPRAAQRKNREGSVILAFTISSDGIIENIHINRSSGYNILDNAAIRALNKIQANKDFALALNGNSTELTVPVNYRLLNLN